ncbi:MAG: 4Fe-4S dicluster domain-containing protein [Candidatus Electrothrix aestuarii]|uniref:4Fe-4S dicluster domain-containing protein n=1 Tax=Candidatus Electrothrix aestuarii TaxID=3062594 RepID=A0AAU8LXS8_9BACT|nr:4Fe-4S dicluster domain-containing protein [Candidatus Electrothrix aestuarii]WPD22630.1 MAG: 4Fe-4S dicluster domain-containing protein [Candidatus Electrothrix sp. GW3-3]
MSKTPVEHVHARLDHDEDLSLLNEVSMKTAGVSRLEMCIQCGSCGGSCPSEMDMDHTPRTLFAMLRAGMREEALLSNTPWICVSCYHCVVRCPQNVHITDVMYTLKGMAIREKKYRDSTAPDFSETFVDMVEKYGRSYEFGLATRHYLKHSPLRMIRTAAMGLDMLKKGRLSMKPTTIEGMDQLTAILNKAKEMELAHE